MTLDEKISHLKRMAQENRLEADNIMGVSNRKMVCIAYAKDQEQLAEWLEELKTYREKRCNCKRYFDCDDEFEDVDEIDDETIDNYSTETMDEISCDALHNYDALWMAAIQKAFVDAHPDNVI